MQSREKALDGTFKCRVQRIIKQPWVPYVLPFAVFIALTAAGGYFTELAHLVYAAKTIIVGAMLWFWRRAYKGDLAPGLSTAGCITAVAAGLAVLAIWILPENILPQFGAHSGFNPYAFGCSPQIVPALIAVRLLGAALVVPVMEELFWRSFLLRYIIDPDFQKVALGTFSWFSFAAVVVLFGLEHHRWIQGMGAGIVYTLLVVRQKSLRGCIIAHTVTNLGLSIYVISTENWLFW